MSGFALRLAGRPGLPPPVRRFYRAMTLMAACFAAGDVSQLVLTFAHPGPQNVQGGVIQTGLFVLGAGGILVVLMLHPTAVSSRRERLRFWLDAATVLIGGAALAWALAAQPGVDRVTALISAGLVLAATFTATKLLYSGSAPMFRRAVLPCIAATATQGVGIFLSSGLGSTVPLSVMLAFQVAPSALLMSGLRIQDLAFPPGAEWPTRSVQRSHNKLPYLATVAAAGTLAVVLPPSAGVKAWGVLVAVLVISVLVSIRQIDAFADNQALIDRLDSSLAALGEKERWYRSLLQHSTDITLVMSAGGLVTFASPAVFNVLGVPPDQTIGHLLAELIHPDDREDAQLAFAELLARPGGTVTISARFRHATGGWRWLDGACTNLLEVSGVESLVCNARDVTEARRFQDQLRHEATHDPLTGLPNRALFTERLAAAAVGRCALLLVDLNDFKLINDVHGHPAGDAVLVGVAERLRECAGPPATPARLGGDEFAVVLPRAGDADAARLRDELRARMQLPIDADGRPLTVGASIGFATGTGTDPEALFSAADQAMYEVKRASHALRQ
jgi:diguanylate cyclase (GGDEF)-like protein/PAS domain S-box-containing protein